MKEKDKHSKKDESECLSFFDSMDQRYTNNAFGAILKF